MPSNTLHLTHQHPQSLMGDDRGCITPMHTGEGPLSRVLGQWKERCHGVNTLSYFPTEDNHPIRLQVEQYNQSLSCFTPIFVDFRYVVIVGVKLLCKSVYHKEAIFLSQFLGVKMTCVFLA